MKPIIILLLLLTTCTITGNTVLPVEENNQQKIQVYFCEKENCEQTLTDLIINAKNTDCALYSLKSEKILNALKEKNARVTIESDNKKDFQQLKFKEDNKRSLMHNKFCIIDGKIITGSWNPADRTKTANNIVAIESKFLSKNYEEEFEELWNWNENEKTAKYPQIILNGKLIENYFCPEDNCQEHVLENLKSAKESIKFMTYSFTDEKIADLLLEKSSQISVSGIFDSSQLNEWSQQEKLQDLSIAKKGVHHKVFIIDDKTAITGSYNPTNNGNKNNDENILIIHDDEVTQKFTEEFNSLFR